MLITSNSALSCQKVAQSDSPPASPLSFRPKNHRAKISLSRRNLLNFHSLNHTNFFKNSSIPWGSSSFVNRDGPTAVPTSHPSLEHDLLPSETSISIIPSNLTLTNSEPVSTFYPTMLSTSLASSDPSSYKPTGLPTPAHKDPSTTLKFTFKNVYVAYGIGLAVLLSLCAIAAIFVMFRRTGKDKQLDEVGGAAEDSDGSDTTPHGLNNFDRLARKRIRLQRRKLRMEEAEKKRTLDAERLGMDLSIPPSEMPMSEIETRKFKVGNKSSAVGTKKSVHNLFFKAVDIDTSANSHYSRSKRVVEIREWLHRWFPGNHHSKVHTTVSPSLKPARRDKHQTTIFDDENVVDTASASGQRKPAELTSTLADAIDIQRDAKYTKIFTNGGDEDEEVDNREEEDDDDDDDDDDDMGSEQEVVNIGSIVSASSVVSGCDGDHDFRIEIAMADNSEPHAKYTATPHPVVDRTRQQRRLVVPPLHRLIGNHTFPLHHADPPEPQPLSHSQLDLDFEVVDVSARPIVIALA